MNTLLLFTRTTKDFSDTSCIEMLFKTLILPKLNYCAPIWTSSKQVNINQLENIQRKLLKRLHYIKTKEYPPNGYSNELLPPFIFANCNKKIALVV